MIMMSPELIREFEKTGKVLSKMRGNEILFDDEPGRMHFVYLAMNHDESALNQVVSEIMAQDDGLRHIVRTLNNLRTLAHQGAIVFMKVLYQATEPHFEDDSARLQKWIQILEAVSPLLRTGLDWIADKSAQYLTDSHFSREQKIDVWLHWCAAQLRSNNLDATFIERVGSARPRDLSRSTINQLLHMLKDAQTRWDLKSSALYLLLGNHLVSLDTANAFIEEAYTSFPLDALEGVETLAIAVEHDAAIHAETDAIHDKLAQMRRENLILKEMKSDDFFAASETLFSSLAQIPTTAIELAVRLGDYAKQERMIAAIFLDETRKAEWLKMAAKSPAALRSLGVAFFSHFDGKNPVLRLFAVDFLNALLENCNIDAVRAETLTTQLALECRDDEACQKSLAEIVEELSAPQR